MLWRTLFTLLLFVPLCLASEYSKTQTEDHAFALGGRLHVEVNIGDVRIVRGDSDKIRVRYTLKSRTQSKVQAGETRFEVHGNQASLELHCSNGGNTSYEVEIEVPQTTTIDAHLSIGDLTLRDIEGDKDLKLGIGDIRVDSDPSQNYRQVEVKTGIGDVNSHSLGESKGFLGKSLKYRGEGKYDLRAHVSIGDITVEEK
jgi:hypothetical protein